MLKVRKDEYASYTFYDGEVELLFDPKKHVYYLVNSEGLTPVDGVTTIVKIIDKSNVLINWAVNVVTKRIIDSVQFPIEYSDFVEKVLNSKTAHREKLEDAGNVGTKVHDWIEKYIKDEHERTRLLFALIAESDERISNGCNAALSWMKNHDVRWVCTEKKIYSREFQYAGTLDGIAIVSSCKDKKCCPNEFKDRLSLIDWKTSNYLYNEYLYQTAAYQRAFEEENKQEIQDRWIILLGKEDGRFSTWHLERTEYVEDFETFKSCLQLTRQTKSVTNRMKLKEKTKKEIKKD